VANCKCKLYSQPLQLSIMPVFIFSALPDQLLYWTQLAPLIVHYRHGLARRLISDRGAQATLSSERVPSPFLVQNGRDRILFKSYSCSLFEQLIPVKTHSSPGSDLCPGHIRSTYRMSGYCRRCANRVDG
jgi:hypothetical protein